MKVLITGSTGLIGHATATHLLNQGWDVRQTDINPPENTQGIDFVQSDLRDYDSIREQVRGCDAIVHMGALRSPTLGTPHEVIQVNTLGTFHVFEAAAQEGIRCVVQASSINAIGCAYNTVDFKPQYFPMDEAHPCYTTDAYSFSKQQIEEIGAYFWRRDQISSVAFRFPGVYEATKLRTSRYVERRTAMRQFIDEFLQLPTEEQQHQLNTVHQHCLDFRINRKMEDSSSSWTYQAPEGVNQHLWIAYNYDRFNLWAIIDVRDAVQAIEKALTAEYEGSHPLFVNETQNTLDYDSKTLAELFFPDLTEWKQSINGSDALVSINKARELIGFEPEYSVHGGSRD